MQNFFYLHPTKKFWSLKSCGLEVNMDESLISSLGYGLNSATIKGLTMPTCSTGGITLATCSPRAHFTDKNPWSMRNFKSLRMITKTWNFSFRMLNVITLNLGECITSIQERWENVTLGVSCLPRLEKFKIKWDNEWIKRTVGLRRI